MDLEPVLNYWGTGWRVFVLVSCARQTRSQTFLMGGSTIEAP